MPANVVGKCDADARVIPPNGGPECAALLSDGDSASLQAKIGFAVGGVFAATSVVLFVLTSRDRKAEAATAAAETKTAAFLGCAPTGPGVTCALRF